MSQEYIGVSLSPALRAYLLVFSVYVGIGPVYWLPFAPHGALDIFKAILFVVVVSFPILRALRSGGVYFPGGEWIGAIFLAILLLSIPGLLQGREAASFYRLQSILQVILFVHACGFLLERRLIYEVVGMAVKVFVLFCGVSLIAMVIIPAYPSPLNDALFLIETGFGGSRTGWSPSIAFFLPWVYVCVVSAVRGYC